MKKYAIFAAVALAGSGFAFAADVADPGNSQQDVCTGGTAAKYNVAGGPGAVYSLADSFIKSGFSVSCSSNAYVSFTNVSATKFTVGSASAKGNQYFMGSSNGGAVAVVDKCAADPCTQTDAQNGDTAASSL